MIAPAVGRVTITPTLDTVLVRDPIVPGDTARLRANALDAAGRVVVGSRILWTSSSTAVATVDSTGLVRSISPGSSTITARSATASGVSTFVVAPLVRRVTVTPPIDTLLIRDPILPSDTVRLRANLFDSNGVPVFGNRTIWSSTNSAVATVDSTGLVRVASLGTVEISARSSGSTGTATFIAAPRFKSISVAKIGRAHV